MSASGKREKATGAGGGTGVVGEAEKTSPSKPKSGDESEEECEVLEESPCGRWQKRREEVGQTSTVFYGDFSVKSFIYFGITCCVIRLSGFNAM